MSDDFTRHGDSKDVAYNKALLDIAKKVETEGKAYSSFKTMPDVSVTPEVTADEDIISIETASKNALEGYKMLNSDQRNVIDTILKALKIPIPQGISCILGNIYIFFRTNCQVWPKFRCSK